ncbi:hypothetical protein [Streptomyces sp. NBC_01264]|uniref:hypothetical protein n=1 Tax=Streptomyces sp. NBC_01264 TaxID=2903804 RepID=UPI00225C2036|nr:hypothetical protein [Streptomyces sp. NBC_01264]MCX4782985.1 hypothetical protein [Streptomyces sp. NBC_01264]
METATSQVIGQLSGYMRGLTQRLDPGAGWYGEFLRRDPQGMRACLDGAAMPPWDVLESLLGDLAGSTGATALAREAQYAAGLRAAAVGVWDRLPGGVEELRTLLDSAAEQRARARDALRVLSARLAETADPAQAQALSRELSWTRDDGARAAARHEDLTSRLEAVAPGATGRPEEDWPGYPSTARPEPLGAVPAQRAATSPGAAWPGPREGMGGGATSESGDAGWAGDPGDPGDPGEAQGAASGVASGWVSSTASGAVSGTASGTAAGAAPGRASGAASAPASGPAPKAAGEPVGRAEGRWLRGARRSGGARYAGAAVSEAGAVTVPPGQSSSDTPLRGARFGRPAHPAAEPSPAGDPGPERNASTDGAGLAAGPARGALYEPARAGSEGPFPGQSSAAAGESGHAGSGPAGGHSGGRPTEEEAWSPAAGRWGDDSGPTGRGGHRPTTPAWSTGHNPAPGGGPAPGGAPALGGDPVFGGNPELGGSPLHGHNPAPGSRPAPGAPAPDRAHAPGMTPALGGDPVFGGNPQLGGSPLHGHNPAPGSRPAPGAPAPGRAPAPEPGPRPHRQGEPVLWPDRTPDPGPRPHHQGEPAPWPDRAPDGSADWPGPGSDAGPHGGSGMWAGPASADGTQGTPAQWQAPAPGAGGQGVSGGSGPGGGPEGAAAQWPDPAHGGSPHGASARWPGAPRGFVEGLVALRSQGRSGEAHALLCEAAAGPAERLAPLGEELGRAGLAADWATLLWEAASLPPARFAAAAVALGPADREALLRQGAARPAAEIAEAALVLAEAGRTEEADALLAAFVRVRTAEEAARLARRDPRWFAPRLLRAAEALSGAHHRDLLHALRVANLPVA